MVWFYIHKLNNTYDKHMQDYGWHQQLSIRSCCTISETRDHSKWIWKRSTITWLTISLNQSKNIGTFVFECKCCLSQSAMSSIMWRMDDYASCWNISQCYITRRDGYESKVIFSMKIHLLVVWKSLIIIQTTTIYRFRLT